MIRGEVWFASLDPVRGSEQAGTRPVLILQADPLNAFLRTVVVVPFTTNLQWAM
jgi:mRNA interferase MazF